MPTVSVGTVLFPQQGAHTATVPHVYTFDAGDTASGTYNVAVTDRATNQTTVPFTVTRDAISPTVTLTLPERIAASDIPVQWTAVETGSGIRGYDLEVSTDGDANWTCLLTETQATTYTFTGTLGVAYTFRIRATDNVSNTSTWVQAEARTVVVKKYYSVAGQRVAVRSNGVVHYIHGDHLGSTSLTTNESGNVAAAQKYLPYGEVRWVTGTLPTDLTYTGQRSDGYIKLTQMGARWYSEKLGRWISADPIIPDPANPQSWNRYSYVYNNALRYIDPTGHIPWWVIAAGAVALVGGGVGAGVIYDIATTPVIKDNSLRPPDPTSADMTNWLIDRLKENAQAPVTQEIHRYLRSANPLDKAGAAKAWVALVGPGAIWDLKENINRAQRFVDGTWNIILGSQDLHFDVVANLHFGFVGRAAGFSEEFLAFGAGAAQVKHWLETKDPREKGEFSLHCYGDHPYATWAVRLGSYLYDRFGDTLDKLDRDAFAQALEDYIKDNPMPDPPPFP